MKTQFTIKSMELPIVIKGEQQVFKTPEIDAAVDLSLGELKGLYELKKEILKEAPALIEVFAQEMMRTMANVYQTYESIDAEMQQEALRMENIDAWFREFFLAPDTTEVARNCFNDYFNDYDLTEGKTAFISRIDFFELAPEIKKAFYKKVCTDLF